MLVDTGGIKSAEDNLRYLRGEEPLLSSGIGSSPDGPGNSTSPYLIPRVPASSEVPQSQLQSIGSTPSTNLSYGANGSTQDRLIRPISSLREQTQGSLEGLKSNFLKSAGGPISFEGLGGAQALTGAINQGKPADFERARSILQAAYKGPKELGQDALGKISQGLGDLSQTAGALRSGEGITSSLGFAIPGLTPGEARFESQKLRYDPNFQSQALREQQNIARLGSLLEQEDSAAKALAGQRDKEAEAVRRAGKAFLGTEKSALARTLEAQKGVAQSEDQAVRDRYSKLLETGALGDVPEDLQAGFKTSGLGLSEDAKQVYLQIMRANSEQNPAITPYEPLEKIITKRGREWYGMIDPKTGKVVDIRKIKGLSKGMEHALVERQRQLERALGPDLGRKYDKTPSKYRDVAPLYDLGQGLGDTFADRLYKPQDIRPYVALEEGTAANLQNTSTEAQRAKFNAIHELLDEADRLEAAGQPFQASKITADAGRYLADEEALLAERGEKLTEGEKAWHKALKKTRSRYKEAQAKRPFVKAIKSVTGSDSMANAVGNVAYAAQRGDVKGLASASMAFANPMLYAKTGMEGAQSGGQKSTKGLKKSTKVIA